MKSNLKGFVSVLVILAAQPFSQPAFAGAGGNAGGGGNTVGTQLFDDWENSGAVVIPNKEIQQIADGYLKQLDRTVPSFAWVLRGEISEVTWYADPKPLKQSGECKDSLNSGLVSPNTQTVQACQSNLEVRISSSFFQKYKQEALSGKVNLLSDLIVHELIMYKRIHARGGHSISQDSVMLVSRGIRNRQAGVSTPNDLSALISQAGFGEFAPISSFVELQKIADFSKKNPCGREEVATRLNNLNPSEHGDPILTSKSYELQTRVDARYKQMNCGWLSWL